MKKILLKFTFILITTLIAFSSCEMKDELLKNGNNDDEVTGAVSLRLEVQTTKSVSSGVNVDDFIVQILNRHDEIVKEYESYASLKDTDYIIDLPLGDYKLLAASYAGEVEEAVFDKPYYYGKKEFTVSEKELVNLKDTCRIGNVKVHIDLDDDFQNAVGDYVVTLTNGTGILNINKENSGDAYFKVSRILNIAVRGTTVNGQSFYSSKSYTGPNSILEEGHSFEISLGVNDTIPSNPGPGDGGGGTDPGDGGGTDPGITDPDSPSFEITINVEMKDRYEEIIIPRPGDEDGGGTDPGDGGGTDPGTDPGDGGGGTDPDPDPDPNLGSPIISGARTLTFDLDGNCSDPTITGVQVGIEIPNGLKHLYVNITSTSDSFMEQIEELGLDKRFDLVNPGNLKDVLSNPFPDGIGLLSPNEQLENKKQFLFDVTSFVPLLLVFKENTHNFILTVDDGINSPVSGTLTLKFVQNL